jgi:alpha/beta superfamily hydrolase
VAIQLDPAESAAATSVAPDGSAEHAEFRGEPGSRVFTYAHLPASAPRGAVVICSPLHGEFAKNYRREVLLSRALADRGFAALRFHYRFTGNSDGEPEDLTFESMRDDTLGSIDHLRAAAPAGPLVIVGSRWGALIAASAAGRHGDAALVLWEPLLDASRFFRDAFRSRLVREVRRGAANPESGRDLEERLRSGEPVDVVAHRLEPRLYASSLGRSLEAELGSAPRSVLAIQVGPTGSVRPELDRLATRWREAGLRVDAQGVRGDETWWLVEERFVDETTKSLTGELIERTVAWIANTDAGAAA